MQKPLDSHHEQIKERVAALLKDQIGIERKIDEMRALCSHPQHGGNACLVCGQELEIGSAHYAEEDEPTCANLAE